MSLSEVNLVSFVEKLVRSQECVVVPGLGGFITRDHSASLNRFNGQLKPLSRTIFFNDILRQDDGLLLACIVAETGMSQADAEQWIQREVQQLLQRCASHEQQIFGTLGSFYLNQHDKLFFLPSVALNLADGSFGLQPVQLEAVVETLTREIRKPLAGKVVPEVATVSVEPISISTETSRVASRPNTWKVAAAIAILSLSTAAGIRLSTYFRKEPEAVITATLGSETMPSRPLTSVPKKVQKAAPTSIDTAAKAAVPVKKGASKTGGNYKIIAACFITEKAAIEELKRLATKGVTASSGRPTESSLYRVMVGEATNPQQAATMATNFTRTTKIRVRVEYLHLP